MLIKLLCFGITKEIIGQFEHQIELPDNQTIADLRAEIIVQFPDFQKLKSLKFALNDEYVGEDTILKPNAEIVLIPPVSGG
jgi:molybdopterin converting factor subunit 1